MKKNILSTLTTKLVIIFRQEGIWAVFKKMLYALILFRRNKNYYKMLSKSDLEDKFSFIFKENIWSSKESVSGTGSEFIYTEPLRFWLKNTIPDLNIKEIVDAPCGDFNWMQHVLPDLEVTYLGIDIVSDLISNNRKKYQNNKIQFNEGDICRDLLPDCDLIITRDCLFHLSYSDINKFLENLVKVNYRYLLTTTHVLDTKHQNTDIVSGDFRKINLFSKPFHFDQMKVISRVLDCPPDELVKREMILLDKESVPSKLKL
jgi:hypothetical protein